MKLSVIVPVYNTSKYLRKCIDSIINQTLKDLEIILVDDGSTDNSYTILEEYKEKYPNKITVIKKENGGQGSARNKALSIAKGEYIGFIDSDDSINHNMYQEMINLATKENDDIVICGIEDYYEKNQSTQQISLDLKEEVTKEEALIKSIPSVVNKIYKRNLFEDNKIRFNEKIWYEDFPTSMNLIVLSKKIGYINKPFYQYFHRIKSTMHNENIKRNLDIIKAYDDLISFYKKNNYDKTYQEELSFLLLKEVYLAPINRIIRTNNSYKEKKEVINQIIDYCNKHSLNKTKYFATLSNSYKISYYLIQWKLYRLLNILFKIKEKLR